jgi:hypothetical protein
MATKKNMKTRKRYSKKQGGSPIHTYYPDNNKYVYGLREQGKYNEKQKRLTSKEKQKFNIHNVTSNINNSMLKQNVSNYINKNKVKIINGQTYTDKQLDDIATTINRQQIEEEKKERARVTSQAKISREQIIQEEKKRKENQKKRIKELLTEEIEKIREEQKNQDKNELNEQRNKSNISNLKI